MGQGRRLGEGWESSPEDMKSGRTMSLACLVGGLATPGCGRADLGFSPRAHLAVVCCFFVGAQKLHAKRGNVSC